MRRGAAKGHVAHHSSARLDLTHAHGCPCLDAMLQMLRCLAFSCPVTCIRRYNPPEPPPCEPHVLRPLYSRGREVWLYDDTTHLHSTPDRQSRQSLWRFM